MNTSSTFNHIGWGVLNEAKIKMSQVFQGFSSRNKNCNGLIQMYCCKQVALQELQQLKPSEAGSSAIKLHFLQWEQNVVLFDLCSESLFLEKNIFWDQHPYGLTVTVNTFFTRILANIVFTFSAVFVNKWRGTENLRLLPGEDICCQPSPPLEKSRALVPVFISGFSNWWQKAVDPARSWSWDLWFLNVYGYICSGKSHFSIGLSFYSFI